MKGRRFFTQADIDRYIKQGYGQGEGANYKPWLRVQDVPSHGRSRKVPGLKADRPYQVLSDLEYAYLLVLEFSEQVIDIREQYPLLPLSEAQRVAADLGIKYPNYPLTQVPAVLSTDFLVTYLDAKGQKRMAARTTKYECDLSPKNPDLRHTLEKLEIDRAFWGAESWKVVTESCIGKETLHNLHWLRSGALLESDLCDAEIQRLFVDVLSDLIGSDRSLSSLLRTVGNATHITYPQAIVLFKHLVWVKTIRFDLRGCPLKLTWKAPLLTIHREGGVSPLETPWVA